MTLPKLNTAIARGLQRIVDLTDAELDRWSLSEDETFSLDTIDDVHLGLSWLMTAIPTLDSAVAFETADARGQEAAAKEMARGYRLSIEAQQIEIETLRNQLAAVWPPRMETT